MAICPKALRFMQQYVVFFSHSIELEAFQKLVSNWKKKKVLYNGSNNTFVS